ncbi:citrate synthase [Granulicoccus phenolivorans]|uniref:citrate synthase n=1 Tax=Granulicoccus phenolivorans TaxID=266854 RepID=UPI00040A0889|nr:citrate synthase [Granulicoccus phenolivorans]
MSTEPAVLHVGDKQLELPLTTATVGNSGYGISNLMKETGNTTLDPGYTNTASCVSSITFIDGDQGVLLYRGYPIEQLAEKSSFLETAYLLIYGELPTEAELADFQGKIADRSMIDERMRDLYRCFPRKSHPMQVLAAGVMALSSFNNTTLSVTDPEQIEEASLRLLGQFPTLAAYAYKNTIGEPFLYPQKSLSYVENFLRLSFGNPTEEYPLDPAVVAAFDTLFILHADHEQNCSTSTVRLVGSAEANIFASVASGVNALSGPLHGGANQAVLEMLTQIRDEGLDAKQFVAKVKDKEFGVKLMGFGHRVYRNFDPRARILKKHADQILHSTGGDNALLSIALELEEIALHDEYFVSRKLYPNVDFYSGLIYEAMGFPPDYFTALFALGRLPGWIAQWREQLTEKGRKIGRPRQVYIGETKRNYPGFEG